MIVIKVELWPGGDEKRAQDLGTAEIVNRGRRIDGLTTYGVRLLKGRRYSRRNAGKVYREGTVEAFPRDDRRWGPWELIGLALEAVVGDRLSSLRRYLQSRN